MLSRYSSGEALLPVIAPLRRRPFFKNPSAITVFLVIMLAIGCLADYSYLSSRVTELAPLVDERQRLADGNTALASRIQARENALRARETERTQRKELMETAEKLEGAWGGALEAMARLLGENAVITAIRSEEDFRGVVEGVAASYKDVGEEFVILSEPFAKLGWKLLPGSISERTDGSTVRFTFTMIHEAAEEKEKALRSRPADGSYYDDYYNY